MTALDKTRDIGRDWGKVSGDEHMTRGPTCTKFENDTVCLRPRTIKSCGEGDSLIERVVGAGFGMTG